MLLKTLEYWESSLRITSFYMTKPTGSKIPHDKQLEVVINKTFQYCKVTSVVTP